MLVELINGKSKKSLSEICEPVDYIPEMIKAYQLLTRFDKVLSKTSIVMMCGAKGSRLGNLSEDTPKPLVKIHDKTIAGIII